MLFRKHSGQMQSGCTFHNDLWSAVPRHAHASNGLGPMQLGQERNSLRSPVGVEHSALTRESEIFEEDGSAANTHLPMATTPVRTLAGIAPPVEASHSFVVALETAL